MTLLLPDPRPRVGLEQPQRTRSVDARRLGRVELDTAEVLCADIAVLVRAYQSGRRTVVAVERTTVETVGDQHVLPQRVLERRNRPVAVETAKDEMRDRGAGSNGRLDERAVERLEGDSLPVQPGRRPPRDAVEIGVELSPGKGREQLERQDEGLRHGSSDLDRRLGGDWRDGSAEVRTEPREAVYRTLPRWKRHDPAGAEGVMTSTRPARAVA